MQTWRVLTVPLICWAASSAAPLTGPAVFVPFSQAREFILSRNAALKSADIETEAAMSGVSQAGVLSNPSLAVTLDRFGTNEVEATVEQTFQLGGKRRLRAAAAQRDLDAARNSRSITRLELEAEMVRRFVPIAAAGRKLALLDSIVAIAEATREQVWKRVEAGASKKTDLVRTDIEIEKLKMERSQLAQEEEQTRSRFAALGGAQDSVLFSVSGTVADAVEAPSLRDLLDGTRRTPQLRSADIEMERLAAQQKLLRAEAAPDLGLTAGYLRNNADRSNSPLLGLSIDIPLFDRNAAAQKQAELQRQAAGQRRENTLRLVEAEVRGLHARLLELDKRVATLRTSAIPKAESVHSMMLEYYSAGSVGFLELTASRSEMLRLRMDLLDTESERALVLADLMQATSIPITIVK